MNTVKARKQGNAVMVTLSSTLAVEEGQEFYCYKDSKGIISLIPKIEDFFEDTSSGEFVDKEDDLTSSYTPRRSELDD